MRKKKASVRKPSLPSSPAYLSPWRRRASQASNANTRNILEQAQSDRARVIFSSSFRRLAQKTQVFALESAEVRNRMTHSLEVAHVGIYIVEMLFKILKKHSGTNVHVRQWRDLNADQQNAIRSFVETACLVHDLGNPPFGHFGEKAIRNWFEERKGEQWFKKATTKPQCIRDFLFFDGNKQTFRILTRLQRNINDAYGLNLTATQLASTIKYPKFNSEKPEKLGFFVSEASIKRELWARLGLKATWRHPFSLLMEAADDIAYCVSDLEDAAEKGLVTSDDLCSAFNKNQFSVDGGDLTKARTDFTNRLVNEAANKFVERLELGAHCLTNPLIDSHSDLDRQKSVTREKVYSSRLVLANEVTGSAVISGLLDHFVDLRYMEPKDFQQLATTFIRRESFYAGDTKAIAENCTKELGFLALLSRKHMCVYLDEVQGSEFPEMFHRVHLVVDMIAGMTDRYALETYRLLSGQVLHGHRH